MICPSRYRQLGGCQLLMCPPVQNGRFAAKQQDERATYKLVRSCHYPSRTSVVGALIHAATVHIDAQSGGGTLQAPAAGGAAQPFSSRLAAQLLVSDRASKALLDGGRNGQARVRRGGEENSQECSPWRW